MTREEQITQAARDIALNWNVGRGNEFYYRLDKLTEIARWADEHPKSPWISVKDRLPEKINKFMSEPVLCRYTRGSKEYFHVSQYDFEFDEWQISNVTHWMPIPELPKE